MRMSRYSRARGRSRQGGDKNSFWLSFSDLMSALVLVIILVLFYILYQYFLMYDDYEARRDQMVILQSSLEQSEADIATQQAALDAAQSELTAAQDELDAKNSALTAAQDELTAAQNELTAAQEDLAVQQLLLEAAQRAADQTQEELDARETNCKIRFRSLNSSNRSSTNSKARLLRSKASLNSNSARSRTWWACAHRSSPIYRPRCAKPKSPPPSTPPAAPSLWPATCCSTPANPSFPARAAHASTPSCPSTWTYCSPMNTATTSAKSSSKVIPTP